MNKIYKTKFKNIEGICVETTKLKAIFLPENGSKLVSLVDKETEYEILAQDENEIYLPQSENSNYVENEVSAVDDLFPTIDPCRTGFASNAEYPCHGEVLRFPHSFEFESGKLITVFKSQKFGYVYEKNVRGEEDGSLTVSYKIKNTTNENFPCIFGVHCMISAEEGGKVLTFEDTGEGVIMFDEDSQFGNRFDKVKVNENMLISTAFFEDGNAYKFYLEDKKSAGRCGYFNPKINKSVILSFDKDKLPYLGIWMNNGKFKKMHNAALEPCTIPYDSVSLANEKGYSFIIPAKGEFSVDINYDVREDL